MLAPRSQDGRAARDGAAGSDCGRRARMSSNTVGETPTRTDYVTRINDVALPDTVLEHVEAYERAMDERDRFLWKWIYSLFPAFTLGSVPEEHAETVRVQKTVLTILVTTADDVAEKRRDVRTFDDIYRLVFWPDDDRSVRGDEAVVALADRLWSGFEAGLADAPRHDEFRDVLEYDLRQAFDAMDYSRLVNDDLAMANLNGATHYGPHNMVMFPYADVDLAYSPEFDQAEFGAVRDLVWDLQKMARIGNWLTTWEREVDERDFTAGIVVYALQHGIVTVEELESAGPTERVDIVRRIKDHGVEDRFVDEWWRRYHAARDREFEATSVDLAAFVDGMETVMEHHLASRGRK